MKIMKKLGLALVLAVACILAAPAVPAGAPTDTQAEASTRKRRISDYVIFYVCHKEPCPAADKECCVIRTH